MLPPIDAIGTVSVDMWGPSPGYARWGSPDTVWGGTAFWSVDTWQNVTPQSMNAKSSWGSDDGSQGVLAMAAAGTWVISTYDPDRLLDPSNVESPYASVLRPGTRVRLLYTGVAVRDVKGGAIDTITYDLETERGTIRATDGIAMLEASKVPAGTLGAPSTLRARARWLTDGMSWIGVEADPPEGDPTVGGSIDEEASRWEWLNKSAFDVLHAVWIGADNLIRFRAFGSPRDLGLEIGGDGIPLENIVPKSSLAGVYSQIIAYDVAAPTVPVVRTDPIAAALSGGSYYERERPVPNAAGWADSVLADRASAALQYGLGRLRPRTEAELLALLDTGMVDIAHVVVAYRDEGRETLDPPIEASPRVLGGSFEANTLTGWSAELVTYVPAQEWEEAELPPPPEPPPPDPDPPPPPATQTVTRTYTVTKDARAARTSGGANYGSGTEGELPVGAWAGWRNRAFLAFAAIPWGDVLEVVSAELRVVTTTQVNIGFGSSPKVRVRRITQSWSEGSLSTPGSANALVYPGPNTTTTGEATPNVTGSESTLVAIPITAIARAWAPVAAGGSGAVNYGLAIFSYAEDSTSRTTEFWAREHGSSTDAEIRITVKIPA